MAALWLAVGNKYRDGERLHAATRALGRDNEGNVLETALLISRLRSNS